MRLLLAVCLYVWAAPTLWAGTPGKDPKDPDGARGKPGPAPTEPAPPANYAEVLQKSLFFYEAQRSGPQPSSNRVSWRGATGLTDGADHGVDLVGGFHDAGDHVKFTFPLAYTATVLAWSLDHDRQAYIDQHQMIYAYANLREMTDWLLKAHTAPNELYAQVGSGSLDHAYWGAPEVMAMARPSYKIDQTCPGTDLAAETAAALAASSLVFRDSDPAYSVKLVTHAMELYSFADTYRGKYSDCVKASAEYYNSWSGFQDELVWGAAWLYKATADQAYLAKAELEFLPILNDPKGFPRKNTLSWDDKTYGAYVMLAELTGKSVYEQAAESWLDFWTGDAGPGEHVTKTPGGLAWLGEWGSLRHVSSTSMMALYYSQYLAKGAKKLDKATAYAAFAKRQIDYILGANPQHISYVVGYTNHYPQQVHHRAAHGSWSGNIQVPVQNRHILYGALVGGPSSNDSYEDNRSNYAQSEVALDYNAGFTGAVANLAASFGGQIDPAFPAAEHPVGEFAVASRINGSGPDYVEIATKLHDHTAFPARFSSNLAFCYFISLAGIPLPERSLSQIKISVAWDQSNGGVSNVQVWDEARGIYYVEVSFRGQQIGPVGDFASTREVQFRFTTPATWRSRWDPRAGWSAERGGGSPGGEWSLNEHIAVYEGAELRYGATPP